MGDKKLRITACLNCGNHYYREGLYSTCGEINKKLPDTTIINPDCPLEDYDKIIISSEKKCNSCTYSQGYYCKRKLFSHRDMCINLCKAFKPIQQEVINYGY